MSLVFFISTCFVMVKVVPYTFILCSQSGTCGYIDFCMYNLKCEILMSVIFKAVITFFVIPRYSYMMYDDILGTSELLWVPKMDWCTTFMLDTHILCLSIWERIVFARHTLPGLLQLYWVYQYFMLHMVVLFGEKIVNAKENDRYLENNFICWFTRE